MDQVFTLRVAKRGLPFVTSSASPGFVFLGLIEARTLFQISFHSNVLGESENEIET